MSAVTPATRATLFDSIDRAIINLLLPPAKQYSARLIIACLQNRCGAGGIT
jgi:hypothetical protein